MKPVAYHCEADVEVVATAKYYRCQRDDLGIKFLHALHAVLAEIQESPSRFPYYERPMRARRIFGFPYRVVYEETGDCIYVISVMHLSRDPSYLKNRLS